MYNPCSKVVADDNASAAILAQGLYINVQKLPPTHTRDGPGKGPDRGNGCPYVRSGGYRASMPFGKIDPKSPPTQSFPHGLPYITFKALATRQHLRAATPRQ
eukprot:11135194-Karenia_brevis.AAC.1